MVPIDGDAVRLADCTTLRLGGPAGRFVRAVTSDEVMAAVAEADRAGEPVLVLGGGSNLVVADEGFPGTVVHVETAGIDVTETADAVSVTVAAGEDWDQLAEWAADEKLAGIECLAGIPGLVGATPIQNVGAYGQEICSVIDSVLVYDREAGAVTALRGADCAFGYRTSRFKAMPGRHVVLGATFLLRRDPMSRPVRYAELAARLGVAVGDQVPLAQARAAVLELRRGKGMVLDPADPDTVSAGSFFTNPVLSADQLARLAAIAPEVPRFAAGDGLVKVPAAWLIEHAGFGRGFPGSGPVRISSKHTLALTNRGGGTASELIALARQIVAAVRDRFGVTLVNEPVLIGVEL